MSARRAALDHPFGVRAVAGRCSGAAVWLAGRVPVIIAGRRLYGRTCPGVGRRLVRGRCQSVRAKGRVGGWAPGDVGVDQRAANVGDVDDSDQAGVAADRQIPEMAAGHDLGGVTDAGRRVDDGRPGGHQLPDPQVVEVFAVRDRAGDVSLGEDAWGWPVWESRTVRAVALACFIR
jgi:hypothetical protein